MVKPYYLDKALCKIFCGISPIWSSKFFVEFIEILSFSICIEVKWQLLLYILIKLLQFRHSFTCMTNGITLYQWNEEMTYLASTHLSVGMFMHVISMGMSISELAYIQLSANRSDLIRKISITFII